MRTTAPSGLVVENSTVTVAWAIQRAESFSGTRNAIQDRSERPVGIKVSSVAQSNRNCDIIPWVMARMVLRCSRLVTGRA